MTVMVRDPADRLPQEPSIQPISETDTLVSQSPREPLLPLRGECR